jgi:putative methionine-R-sulfoxide reductase with GAF domain
MIDLFKDRYKLGLLLATLFFVGIIASIYSIYALPHDLNLTDGYRGAFTSVYTTLVITFLIGAVTIWQALNYRNEIIVFKDKQLQDKISEANNADSNLTTISLESVKANLKQAQTEKEILQAGIQTICKQLDAGQGAIYIIHEKDGRKKAELKSGYALAVGDSTVIAYETGEGLIGQSAMSGKTLYIDDVPEGYIKILSGLGSASPKFLLIVPLKKQDTVLGVMEIASFTPIQSDQRKFVEESAQLVAEKIAGPQA